MKNSMILKINHAIFAGEMTILIDFFSASIANMRIAIHTAMIDCMMISRQFNRGIAEVVSKLFGKMKKWQ